MNESNLRFSEQKLDELTKALFENTDADHSGSITFEELQEELSQHPGVVENLTISAANWLKPPPSQQRRDTQRNGCSDGLPHWLSWKYLQNNWTWVSWINIFLLVNCFLFVEAAIRHRSGVSDLLKLMKCVQFLVN